MDLTVNCDHFFIYSTEVAKKALFYIFHSNLQVLSHFSSLFSSAFLRFLRFLRDLAFKYKGLIEEARF